MCTYSNRGMVVFQDTGDHFKGEEEYLEPLAVGRGVGKLGDDWVC